MARILIVEDEAPFRERFGKAMARAGHDCVAVGSCAEGEEALQDSDFDVAFLDLKLPDGSGLDLLGAMRDACPQTAVVLMTAFAQLDSAIEALRNGAVDYFEKPFPLVQALHRLDRILQYRQVVQENMLLRRELGRSAAQQEIVGDSEPMQRLRELIQQVAPTPSNVLLTGESGTGKDLVAREIHRLSGHRGGPFVAVNCAAIPSDLLESELFGHERGAFTGAVRARAGVFELADGGTLFLDEIAEMTPALQAKLLRVIETRQITRVGGTRAIGVKLRLIAATNRALERQVAGGAFREDLYYRIRVMEIALPPLRARAGDVPLLARHFVNKLRGEIKRPCRGVSNAAMRLLLAYRWPGNVRELQNVIERALILSHGEWIEPEDLPAEITQAEHAAAENLRAAVNAYEREHIRSVLQSVGHDRKRAADQLGIGLSSLYRKLQQLGISETT